MRRRLLCQPLQSFHDLIKELRSQQREAEMRKWRRISREGYKHRTPRRRRTWKGWKKGTSQKQREYKGHVCFPLFVSMIGKSTCRAALQTVAEPTSLWLSATWTLPYNNFTKLCAVCWSCVSGDDCWLCCKVSICLFMTDSCFCLCIVVPLTQQCKDTDGSWVTPQCHLMQNESMP